MECVSAEKEEKTNEVRKDGLFQRDEPDEEIRRRRNKLKRLTAEKSQLVTSGDVPHPDGVRAS